MDRPKELDVPHWAQSMVGNYRRNLALSEAVTDSMIYARLEECGSMDPEDITAAVGNLGAEMNRYNDATGAS